MLVRRSWLLGAVCALFAVFGVGQAVASTVSVSPGGGVTASISGGVSNVLFLHVGTTTVSFRACTIAGSWSNASGALPLAFSGPVGIASPIENTKGNFDIRCTGCTVSITCTMTCDARANVLATAATSGGSTALRITGIRCTIVPTGQSCVSTLSGTSTSDGGVAATYNNAASTLTVDAPTATNQRLAVTRSSCMVIPVATATLSGVANGPAVFSVTPRTAVTVV